MSFLNDRHPLASARRSRGYLPHYDAAARVQHVVFRLFDSLSSRWVEQLDGLPAAARLAGAEAMLDFGHGSRALSNAQIAGIVRNSLLHFADTRYRLIAWCVMPTHVHALVDQIDGWPLPRVLHAWKSYTANRANAALGRSGPFWAREYFDRAMREEEQMETTVAYIEANPVAAGLCATPADWPWSSASER